MMRNTPGSLAAWCLIPLAWCAVSDLQAGPLIQEADLQPTFRNPQAAQAARAAAAGDWETTRSILLDLSARGPLPEAPERLRFLLGAACVQVQDAICASSVLENLEREVPLVADRVAWMRAQALLGLDRASEAADLLARFPADSLKAKEADDLRLEALWRAGRRDEAEQLLRSRATEDAAAATRLSEILRERGDRAGALEVLQKAWNRLSFPGRRTLEEAWKALGAAPPATPPPSALDRAQALLDAQRSQETLEAVRPLIQDPATRCEALRIRAQALGKLRRHPEAWQDWKTLLDQCSGRYDVPRTLYQAARSAWRAGQGAEGDRLADRLAREVPDSTLNDDLAVARGRQALAAGRHGEARRLLRDSLARWPDGDMALESRWLLAWSLWTSGELPEMVRLCQESETRAARDPEMAARFAYWRARALQKTRHAREAEAAYQIAAERYPLTFYAFLALGRLADQRKTSPDQVLRQIPTTRSRPGPFLTLQESPIPGGIQRALWLLQTGLASWALEELQAASDASTDAVWLAAWVLERQDAWTQSHRLADRVLSASPFWPDAATARYVQLAFPRPYRSLVEAAARESRIDPMLIWAVMRAESAFSPRAESWANALGLMQLILPTARSMGKRLGIPAGREDVLRPEVNIRLGAAYLSQLLQSLKEPLLAIPGYNAGGGAIRQKRKEIPHAQVDEFVESIGANETRDYARKVFRNWAIYRLVHGEARQRLPRVRFTLPVPE
ncbi:MAG TPA: transglycosylase SLT domain-containing protein [Myxococcota bacterium]|nr:transglycosylase SLT domain-containing protein [Myxococcota bacterium]HQK51986.1 transglycosylase SLT domain-containing protein [Myxococcota bacterium]